MNTKPTFLILLISMPLVLVGSGCATTKRAAAAEQRVHPIYFGDVPGWHGEAPRPGDLEQEVRFALAVAEAGRHEEAASLFEELAPKVQSERQAFEQALLLAAANERFKAGQPALATRNIETYLERSDHWRIASLEQEDRMLLALREVARNLERTSSTRNLLRSLNSL